MEKHNTYDKLLKHPFPAFALHYAVRIRAAIAQPGSVMKVESEYKRSPTKTEHYCIGVGGALANALTICEQLEHSVLYFSSFSPTDRMKKGGISRHSHLLYCIENYIIRTQSMYDRLLILIDHVFDILNPSHVISHELIICNSHVKRTSLPAKLKKLRKIIKPYYYDRNVIIHEQQYLEDDLRRLEGYTILAASPGPYQGQADLIQEAKLMAREIVKNKTAEFSNTNRASFETLDEILTVLFKVYENTRTTYESLHGRPELAPVPTVKH